MNAERELDVFAGELRREAVHFLENVAPPDLEGADGAQHHVQPSPAEPIVEERSEIVEVLEGQQGSAIDPAWGA